MNDRPAPFTIDGNALLNDIDARMQSILVRERELAQDLAVVEAQYEALRDLQHSVQKLRPSPW